MRIQRAVEKLRISRNAEIIATTVGALQCYETHDICPEQMGHSKVMVPAASMATAIYKVGHDGNSE